MRTSVLVSLATQSILKNKLRTFLTMLGIVIGVAAVIIMVAVGYGAQLTIAKQISSLGTNIIMVTPGSSSAGGVNQGAATFNRLTLEDVEKLRRESLLLAGITPVVFTHTQAIGGTGNWRTIVNGVSANYLKMREWRLRSGEFFTESDVRGVRKVAVLGSTVASNLFPDGDAVGHPIQLRDTPFVIIGVLTPKGQGAGGSDSDDVIVVPYTTAHSRLTGGRRVHRILASTYVASDIPAAQEEIRGILRESHKLSEAAGDDFTIRNQDEIAAAAQSTTKVMTWLLAAIASISLLVGGIGIMNIMLVSVSERTREIGIRMAIGARCSDVLTQFLIESVAISVAGGLIGVLVGFAGAALASHVGGWNTVTPPEAVVLAVGFSAAVGIFFGFYPAQRAAALNPVQALRYE